MSHYRRALNLANLDGHVATGVATNASHRAGSLDFIGGGQRGIRTLVSISARATTLKPR